jgi:hypothetical protein
MNKFLALIGLAALALAFTVDLQAQVPTYAAQTLWSTNGAVGAGIPSATAPAINAVMDVRKQKDVTLQIFTQGDTSVGTGSLVFTYSVDGISYSASAGTAGTVSMVKTVLCTPTTAGATLVTNLNTFGCGYMKFLYYTNDTGASVTNMVVKYGVKISAP